MASLKEKLQQELTASMKARNEVATSTLRMALAAILDAEVAGDQAIELSDVQTQAVLASEAKKRTEAADIYGQAGRTESQAAELAELAVLERFFPARISDSDLELMVDQEIASAKADGNSGVKAMGLVVKAVRNRAGQGADGAKIAKLVKDKISV